jgi:hypothetical protein
MVYTVAGRINNYKNKKREKKRATNKASTAQSTIKYLVSLISKNLENIFSGVQTSPQIYFLVATSEHCRLMLSSIKKIYICIRFHLQFYSL